MSTVNEWRVFCVTESAWVTWLLYEGEPAPTICSNDTEHDINLHSVNIIDTVSPNTITVEEEKGGKTGGNFRYHGYRATNVPPNAVTPYTIALTYDISLLSVRFASTSENHADVVNGWYMSFYIGAITSDLPTPTTEIPVDAVTYTLLNKGYIVSLTEGGVTEELGEIVSMDILTHTLTMTTPTVTAFTAANAHVKFKVHAIKNLWLIGGVEHIIGTSSIGASFLNSAGSIYIEYTNKSLTDTKSYNLALEYLY